MTLTPIERATPTVTRLIYLKWLSPKPVTIKPIVERLALELSLSV